MIIEIHGKRLAFGLDWKYVASSDRKGGATSAALEAKAPLYWHDGKANYVGVMQPSEKPGNKSGTVYSAAEAFRRLPDLPKDALMVLRAPDGTYLVAGIKDSRPRKGWDAGGLSEERARESFQTFGDLCGETGFALVGESDLPFANEEAAPFSLAELASLVDDGCALKPPSRKAFYVKLAVVGCLGLVLALNGKTLWHKYIMPPKEPQSQKTPDELYSEYVAAHSGDPVVAVADYRGWLDWVHSLVPGYGGWALSAIVCDFRNSQSQPGSYLQWSGQTQCALTYDRKLKAVATNETFVKAVPKEWIQSASYNPSKDQMQVVLHPDVMTKVRVQDVLQNAGTATDRDIHFVSVLQSSGRLVSTPSLSRPAPYLVPPGVPAGGITMPLYMTAGWSFDGQLHYTDLLERFPKYATLGKATLTISESSSDTETPYHVALAGEVITRN